MEKELRSAFCSFLGEINDLSKLNWAFIFLYFADKSSNGYYHFYNDTIKKGKTIFIVGDSYVYAFMFPLLAENFKDVYFIYWDANIEKISKLYKDSNPDYLVYEVVERMTNYDSLLNEINLLTEIIN